MTFYGLCDQCTPAPMPFYTEEARDQWADAHASAGHRVRIAEEGAG